MTDSNRSTFIIAGAIVFAGLIIAAGILFGSTDKQNDSVSNNTQKAKKSQGVDIAKAAQAAGVNSTKVQRCLQKNKFQSAVRKDITDARSAGGRGTPFNVFVLDHPLTEEARSNLSGKLGSNITISKDGQRISLSGAIPLSPLKEILNTTINNQQATDVKASSDIDINEVTQEDYIRGSQDAKVTIVEYSDFKCPYCKRFHKTMKQVMKSYKDDQVAWVFRHMPIQQLHPQAPKLAQASECVASIGGEKAFWKFADEVFAGQ